jgi:hypothetical protein
MRLWIRLWLEGFSPCLSGDLYSFLQFVLARVPAARGRDYPSEPCNTSAIQTKQATITKSMLCMVLCSSSHICLAFVSFSVCSCKAFIVMSSWSDGFALLVSESKHVALEFFGTTQSLLDSEMHDERHTDHITMALIKCELCT